MDNKLLDVGKEQLFTVEQLAEQFGITVDGMRKRIVKLGLEPTVPAKAVRQGKTSALYDLAALTKIQQQQQQSILVEKQRAAGVKCAEGMSLVGRQGFVQATFDELSLDEKMAFTMENMTRMVQELHKALAKVEQEKEVLEITNDISHNYLPAIRTTANEISRFEHALIRQKAIELGYNEGEVKWGDKVELKRYTRIQVKSEKDKYPAWAYPRAAWEALGVEEI